MHNPRNDYWKLNEGRPEFYLEFALRSGRYDVPQNARDDVLTAKYYRMRRGLLCYSKCTLHELKHFASARSIVWAPLSHASDAGKLELVALLERADDEAQFPHFLRLPPELQEQICGHYMEDMPDRLRLPTSPPLARASQHLRRIASPIFYATKTFELTYFTRSQDRHKRPLGLWSLYNDDSLWLHSVSEQDVGNIRSLRIRKPGTWSPIAIKIDMLQDQSRVLWDSILSIDEHNNKEQVASMIQRLQVWVDGIKQVGQRVRLRKTDIHAIRMVIENYDVKE